MKLIMLFVPVPYLPLPLQPTYLPQHTVLTPEHIFFPQCDTKFHTQMFDIYFVPNVMCVVFILEYSLLFFMQCMKSEVTYFFSNLYVMYVCMYVLIGNGR